MTGIIGRESGFLGEMIGQIEFENRGEFSAFERVSKRTRFLHFSCADGAERARITHAARKT